MQWLPILRSGRHWYRFRCDRHVKEHNCQRHELGVCREETKWKNQGQGCETLEIRWYQPHVIQAVSWNCYAVCKKPSHVVTSQDKQESEKFVKIVEEGGIWHKSQNIVNYALRLGKHPQEQQVCISSDQVMAQNWRSIKRRKNISCTCLATRWCHISIACRYPPKQDWQILGRREQIYSKKIHMPHKLGRRYGNTGYEAIHK